MPIDDAAAASIAGAVAASLAATRSPAQLAGDPNEQAALAKAGLAVAAAISAEQDRQKAAAEAAAAAQQQQPQPA